MSSDLPPPPPMYGFNPAAQQGGPAKTSGAAVASLILGALSLLCFCFTAIPGLICGFIGLSNISKSQGKLKGKGLALIGIALSIVLPLINVGVSYLMLKSNPEFMQIFSGGQSMMKAATNGKEIGAAVIAYAGEHEGNIPNSLNDLVASGHLDGDKLLSPVDGSPDFWNVVMPGRKLSEVSSHEIIIKSRPIEMMGESFEFGIFADGRVDQIVEGAGASDVLEEPSVEEDVEIEAEIVDPRPTE